MSSFEFFGQRAFASCQYDTEEFFVVLVDAEGDYPLLQRAQTALDALHDDCFSFANGETKALAREVDQIVQELKIDLELPEKRHVVFGLVAQELKAVFRESEAHEADIKFRWG